MVKKLKELVKRNPEPARGTSGINPSDPWSAKANIEEAAGLSQYLLSKGINPKFVSKDTKISHAKSSSYLKWKQDHQFEEVQPIEEDAMLDKFLLSRGINPKYATTDQKIAHAKSGAFIKWKQDHLVEAVDEKDTITFDIPLLIRILELVREDIKSDPDLHRVVEKLIAIRNQGVLTMDDYDFVSKLKEEVEELAGVALNEVDMEKISPAAQAHVTRGRVAKVNVGYGKPQSDTTRRVQKKPVKQGFLKKLFAGEEVQMEATKTSALDRFRAAAATREKKHNDIEKDRQEKLHQDPSKVSVPDAKPADGMTSAIDRLEKHLNKEEVEQIDEQGTSCSRKSEMSKSARIIKSLYKRKGVVKEDMVDWEKEDKSVQTYGKKPSIGLSNEKDNLGEKKPKARAVMSGGKTLTGQKRDDVEIDPSMVNRPDRPDEVIKDINTKKQNN